MKEEQEKFAAEVNVAVLATVDGKGRPHATPIWYMYENGEFVLSVLRGSQKHRNLERNPEATLVIDRREVPYYALMVSGAVELGPALSDEEELSLSARYLGEELAKRYHEFMKDTESVSLRLRPRRVTEYTGGAVREVR